MFRTGVDEIHKSGAAIELREEDSSISLRLRRLDPLQTRPNAAVVTATLSKNTASIAAHTHFWGDF